MDGYLGRLSERNSSFRLAGAFLLLVVIAGVFLSIRAMRGDDTEPPQTPAAAASTTTGAANGENAGGAGDGNATAAPNSEDDAGCAGVPPSDENIIPSDLEWDIAGIYVLPRSTSLGPMKVEGNARTCYAHSPTGAAMAAVNIFMVATVLGDGAALRGNVAPGLAEAELLERTPPPAGQAKQVHMRGYQVDGYTGESAVVTVAIEIDGYFGVFPVPLLWRDGDWKFDSNADTPEEITAVENLDGFVVLESEMS